MQPRAWTYRGRSLCKLRLLLKLAPHDRCRAKLENVAFEFKNVYARNRTPQRECRLDRYVVYGAQADSRVGDSSGHPVSLGSHVIRDASQFLEELGVQRSHIAIHNWVHKAELLPISTVTSDQLAVDEKMIRLHGQEFWLYGAVDLQTNEIRHISLFPTTNKQTTRWFLNELHNRYQLDDVLFLVDDADYLGSALAEDGYRFRVVAHRNRNAVERVFWEIERRTSSFANNFSNVAAETAHLLSTLNSFPLGNSGR